MRTTLARVAAGVATLAAVTVAPPTTGATGATAPGGTLSGFATGSVAHATLLEDGGTRALDGEVAFSSAAVDEGGLGTARTTETARVVHPALPERRTYAQGVAVEAGVVGAPGEEGQVVVAKRAARAAPPEEGPATEEVGPLAASPAAWASLARGTAAARWAAGGCVTGDDLSRGLGYVVDAEVADTAPDDGTDDLDAPLVSLDAPAPDRAVSQSTSRTRLVPQVGQDGEREGAGLGLMTESRLTIAPVTLFAGTAEQTTIEFAGEWVLRAVATGRSGWVHYGPGDVSPATPVVRVLDAAGEVVEGGEILAQDLLGPNGVTVEVPDVLELTVGEDPRAIGGDADSEATETATHASAAVDVVRLRLLDDAEETRAVDIRLGHLEVDARVPAGGLGCPLIDVAKSVDKPIVTAGEEVIYTVTVRNPSTCPLRAVKVVDRIEVTPGVTYEVLSSDPPADRVEGGVLTWDDVGPLEPGQSAALLVRVRTGDDSAAGRFANTATVEATCDGDLSVRDEARVDAPEVRPPLTAQSGPGAPVPFEPVRSTPSLPATGGLAATAMLGTLLLATALALRLVLKTTNSA